MIDGGTIIKDVKGLIDAVEAARSTLRSNSVWWRGQARTPPAFSLKPGVFRVPGIGKDPEVSAMTYFKLKSPLRHALSPQSHLEWTFLAQHHRLRTRLIDWTESPLIAAFFAIGHELPASTTSEDGIIYALAPTKLNLQYLGRERLAMHSDPVFTALFDRVYNDRIPLGKDVKVYATSPSQYDWRIATQMGGFTIHDTDKDLSDLTGSDDWLIGYRVKGSAKKRIFAELSHLGIRESFLFPDLDHLATELNRSFFK